MYVSFYLQKIFGGPFLQIRLFLFQQKLFNQSRNDL